MCIHVPTRPQAHSAYEQTNNIVRLIDWVRLNVPPTHYSENKPDDNNYKMWRLCCIETWDHPTPSHQSFSALTIIICPIAIAYSMGQIIKSVCVCQCVPSPIWPSYVFGGTLSLTQSINQFVSVSVYQCICPSASTLTVAFLDRCSPKLAQTYTPKSNKKLIRWDSDRELSLRRHCTRTSKYNRLLHKFRNRSFSAT